MFRGKAPLSNYHLLDYGITTFEYTTFLKCFRGFIHTVYTMSHSGCSSSLSHDGNITGNYLNTVKYVGWCGIIIFPSCRRALKLKEPPPSAPPSLSSFCLPILSQRSVAGKKCSHILPLHDKKADPGRPCLPTVALAEVSSSAESRRTPQIRLLNLALI